MKWLPVIFVLTFISLAMACTAKRPISMATEQRISPEAGALSAIEGTVLTKTGKPVTFPSVVELRLPGGQKRFSTILSSFNGTFSFHNVPPMPGIKIVFVISCKGHLKPLECNEHKYLIEVSPRSGETTKIEITIECSPCEIYI